MSFGGDSAVLLVENSSTSQSGAISARDELQFHSTQFTPTTNGQSSSQKPSSPRSKSIYASSFAEEDADQEEDVLLGTERTKPAPAFWQLEYFARYFDVTASQVLARILWSLMPLPGQGSKSNYIERHIQPNPDIYGPFWISATLVFSIAICGNIANYVNSWSQPEAAIDWHYDYTKVGLAASTIFTYVLVVPVTLWFFFWFRGCAITYTLFETICAYGYSLSVYVPISILWVINIRTVQLVLVVIGALLSGSVLVLSFAPVVHSDPAKTMKTSYLVLILIVLMHGLLAFSFLQYFF